MYQPRRLNEIAVWRRPAHCDPTVNMADWWVCHREGRVEAVVPVRGRGAGL
jgi:hypothetical protein